VSKGFQEQGQCRKEKEKESKCKRRVCEGFITKGKGWFCRMLIEEKEKKKKKEKR